MKYIKVTMKNFMVYEKEQTVNLDNQGLILVQGINKDSNGFRSNGAGKSTFLEAIIYCLYGKLSDGTSGDDVINNKVTKGTKVTLTFSIGKDIYRIERYRKDTEFKNKTLLFLNEKEITSSSIKLTNEAIEKLVKMSMETFLNSIMFGLTNKTKFPEATDKEKKQILEDIANISIYKQAYVITKNDLDKTNSDIQLLDSKIAVQKEHLNGIKAQQDLIDQQIVQYQNYIDGLRSSYIDALATLNKFETDNSIKDKKSLDDELNTAKDDLTNIHTKLANINIDSSVSQQYNTYYSQYKNFQADYLNQDSVMKKLQEQLTTLANSTNPVCEYCGSVLDVEHKAKEINRLMADFESAQTRQQEDEKQGSEAKIKFTALKEQLDQEAENKKHYADLSNKQSDIMNEVNSITILISRYENITDQVATAKKAYDNHEPQKVIKAEDKTEDIEKTNNNLKKLNKQKNKLTELRDELKAVEEVYSNKGVISHVLDLIMPYINGRANDYLGELTDNSIRIRINPQSEAKNGNVSEKLNIEVENLNGGNEYTLNSKGEKKRIDLSISLALQDYVMSKSTTKTNFIAYDEVFDGLDDIGIQRIMHLLKERVKDIPTVFVISHNDKLKELFEKTLLITKQEGLSTIEQE